MEITHSIDDGQEGLFGLVFCVDFFFHDMFVQFSSLQVFQDQVDVFSIAIDCVEIDDIGVLDMPHDMDLFFKGYRLFFIHFLPGIRSELPGANFDSDSASSFDFGTLDNLGIGAPSLKMMSYWPI